LSEFSKILQILVQTIALRIEADTGPWLMPVQYERKAWPRFYRGNAPLSLQSR